MAAGPPIDDKTGESWENVSKTRFHLSLDQSLAQRLLEIHLGNFTPTDLGGELTLREMI